MFPSLNLFSHVPSFPRLLSVLLTSLVVCGPVRLAEAGCGCDKAPPPPAGVRPDATYAGTEVTLFHAALQSGQLYEVVFTSGITGESASVSTAAVNRRDLADGQDKTQLPALLPDLPLGPTSISVHLPGQTSAVMTITDDAFTVVPQPLVVPEQIGEAVLADMQAAVSRDGVVYLSLDLSDTTLPRTFQAQALGYPLRFTNNEVVFYNIQGFLMQELDAGMAGLFALDAPNNASDSDILHYSRHEFSSFYLQHAERETHDVNAADPNWHLDDTFHIDHDHMVVAIAGFLPDGSLPTPGATPVFDLVFNTYSLFRHGLVGDAAITMTDNARIDGGYNQNEATGGPKGDIRSNGVVSLALEAKVHGNATAAAFDIQDVAEVTGETLVATAPLAFMPVDLPAALEDLGSVIVTNRKNSRTLVGPASYRVTDLLVTGNGTLTIDNTAGPVTLYVTGRVEVADHGEIPLTDQEPEKFAVYVLGGGDVEFHGQSVIYGAVYAPDSWLEMSHHSEFYGALVGQSLYLHDHADVHYDVSLRDGKKNTGSNDGSGDGGSGGGNKKK